MGGGGGGGGENLSAEEAARLARAFKAHTLGNNSGSLPLDGISISAVLANTSNFALPFGGGLEAQQVRTILSIFPTIFSTFPTLDLPKAPSTFRSTLKLYVYAPFSL
jgi:hypothetical protein